MEYKNFQIKFSNKLENEYGYIGGYASIFNVEDQQHDVILPGAFHNSLGNPKEIKFLWQHNPSEPIGTLIKIEEDEKGLLIEASIPLNIQKGMEAYMMIEQGLVDGLSIGFFIKSYHIDEISGIRYITGVDLKEISVVTFPSNNSALIHNVGKYLQDLQPVYDAVHKAMTSLKNLLTGKE